LNFDAKAGRITGTIKSKIDYLTGHNTGKLNLVFWLYSGTIKGTIKLKIGLFTRHKYRYLLRSETNNYLKIPEKPMSKCKGFFYYGAKLYNKLPCDIKETANVNSFKVQVKALICKNIPYITLGFLGS